MSLSFFSTHPFISGITVISSLFILLFAYIIFLHIKIARFTKGRKAESLEDIINECISGINEIEKRNEVISSHALSLDSRVSMALRNAQTIRFKAFETNGSHQSFSIALLNEKGNGVVISSLHARDRISTFAKPIEKYSSNYDLTEEEKEVIRKSKEEHRSVKS